MNINELIGKTLVQCTGAVGDEEITFKTDSGRTFRMFHEQDCCETVRVEDICGEMSDLVGSPIVQAEENSNSSETWDGSKTWTFYRLATAKGQVVIRWLGESNGYYSERVSFDEVPA